MSVENPELLITGGGDFSLSPAQIQRLAERPVQVHYLSGGVPSASRLANASILWSAPPPEILGQALFLDWLHLSGPCARPYADHTLYVNPHIALTRPLGVFDRPAAEHALSLLLSLYRGDRQGCCFDPPRELYGATAAILGLGEVGQALAALLHSLSVTVLGLRRRLPALTPHVETHDLFDLPAVLSRADLVVSCLPATPETEGLLDRRAFAAMKTGALFVCVGSGAVIDFEALGEALSAGHLAGAGLDAFAANALAPGHPLRVCPEVRITKTAAGDSERANERRFAQFEALLDRYLSGRRLSGLVDFFSGY